jgi:hypothetical protein
MKLSKERIAELRETAKDALVNGGRVQLGASELLSLLSEPEVEEKEE